jgi:DNA polymerase-3 subunit gamma/tau
MLFQKYRPSTFSGVVGQDAAIRQINTILGGGWGGRAWWISGPSGTGKTTLARIIASQGADDWFVEEIDASDLTPQRIKEIERTMCLYSMGKGGRAWIVNEAHGLRRSEVLRLLLTMLERLPSHVVWIFTTTDQGQRLFEEDMGDASPLLSRCHRVELKSNPSAFAKRVRQIAVAENRDGYPESVYLALAESTGGNFRAMLQAVESGNFPTPEKRAPKPAADGCPCGCGKSLWPGKKFASADCYLKSLRANKRKR